MSQTLTVVKVGGAVVEDPASLSVLLDGFERIEGAKVLVHGGGRSATRLATRLGLVQTMVGGRRVTDAETLDVVTMVYGGLVNKQIVAGLQARGVDAIGLTGADGDAIRSRQRPPVRVADPEAPGGARVVDYGWVGDVERVRASWLADLIAGGAVPVVAPLTHDGAGHLLNTNADTIASAVACALAAEGAGAWDVTLTYCFERRGVLRDPEGADTPDNVIPHIAASELPALVASGTVAGGMLPKLENAFAALRAGVKHVVITRSDCLRELHSGTELSL